MISREAHIFLAMSGGVDSSVAAQLLLKQGYKVTGVYMKNWSKDLPGMKCPWAEDLADAKRVAVRLGIDFRVFDFETEYKQKVVDYMLAEYQKGNTPNPDIMCNQEIKFKLFYDTALEQGADCIATGHYAKTRDSKAGVQLLRAKDQSKDQTYFLYRMPSVALNKTIFPLGDMLKSEVKALARQTNLIVAHKKESMGVCFVGDAGIREFLSEFVQASPGDVRELETDKILAIHDGAIFYTLGQRHGLNISSGMPHYVVKKDMKKNIIYVSKNINSQRLWTKNIKLKELLLREEIQNQPILVRVRHRAPLVPATFDAQTKVLSFASEQKSIAPGQSIVFYSGTQAEVCIGGGIVAI